MGRRALLLLGLLLAAAALAGCSHGDDPPGPPATTPTGQEPPPATLTFGGVVVDAVTGEPLPEATIRLDLAQHRPCGRQGILWNAYALPVDAEGRFGPFELPAPRTDQVAFFLHATAPGRTEDVTFIGPAQARAGIHNLSIALHPEAIFEGRAMPGTPVALDAPGGWPRLAVADANGTFRIEGARVAEAGFAAGTHPPLTGRVTPPASLDVVPPEGATWRLEGAVKDGKGAPLAADVVAWNGTTLASVARSGPDGAFVLPLSAQRQDLLVEARTPDGALGGALRVLVEGPPAVRQDVVATPRC